MISSAIGPYDFCILTSAYEIDWPLYSAVLNLPKGEEEEKEG